VINPICSLKVQLPPAASSGGGVATNLQPLQQHVLLSNPYSQPRTFTLSAAAAQHRLHQPPLPGGAVSFQPSSVLLLAGSSSRPVTLVLNAQKLQGWLRAGGGERNYGGGSFIGGGSSGGGGSSKCELFVLVRDDEQQTTEECWRVRLVAAD